jgi:hypothetical protein
LLSKFEAKTFKGIASTLVAAPPVSEANFFGLYDICPFSQDDSELVLLSCPADFLRMPSGEAAQVRIWNPDEQRFRTVGTTTAWNWQHGARQQWLSDGSILYNDLENGQQIARIVSSNGEELRKIPMSVGALNPQETIAVSGNYERLATYYDTYGYHAARNSHIEQSANGDGLWAVDFATGNVDLKLSYARLCDAVGCAYTPSMFVSHPDFAPDGDALCFFLITSGSADTSYMRLMLYRFSTDALMQIAEEKVSHPAWIDNSRLWSWARSSSALKAVSRGGLLALPGARPMARLVRRVLGSAANGLLSEGFFIFGLDPAISKSRVAPELLTEDGHYSKHSRYELMLGDTYPDDTNHLTLLLFSLAGLRIPLARVLHDVKTDDPRLRCDLHPRWDRSGTRVSFDFMERGIRRLGVADVREGMAAAGFPATQPERAV